MKIFFDALGCPKALVDAERMHYFLQKESHSFVSLPEEAEAIVINTCGFIEAAKKESIDVILNYIGLKKEKPSLKIILSGCLTERYRKELLANFPEIDSAIGARDLTKIIDAFDHPSKNLLDGGEFKDAHFTDERSLVFSGYHFAYLKIAEGCNRNCTFCAIPLIRGKQRSRPIESIAKEAAFLKDQGVKELIIISEDTISYGLDLYQKKSLIPLLKELLKLKFDWIRILYLFPDEELLNLVYFIKENPSICRYLDMPLQHVSASLLKSMKRPGDPEYYLSLIERIRKEIPEIKIRSSFIIGFSGETEDEQQDLKTFLKKARLDRVGFFEYSREEGTESYSLTKNIGKRVLRKRIKELSAIQETISENNLKKMIGKEIICIYEGIIEEKKSKEYLVFRSEYDAPEVDGVVMVKKPDNLDPDNIDFVKIKITEVIDHHNLGGVEVL
jgi:ribosomal protein S12 methylthiotransferase